MLGMISYQCAVFLDIRLVTIQWPIETRVRGHSTSSEPTRIDPPPMTSY